MLPTRALKFTKALIHRANQVRLTVAICLLIVSVHFIRKKLTLKKHEQNLEAELQSNMFQANSFASILTTSSQQQQQQQQQQATPKVPNVASEFFRRKLLSLPSTINAEWSDLNQKIFFHKTSAIYFQDQRVFSVMFLSSQETFDHLSFLKFKLDFQVLHEDGKTTNIWTHSVTLKAFHLHLKVCNVKLSSSIRLNPDENVKIKEITLRIALILEEVNIYKSETIEAMRVRVVERSFASSTAMRICLEPSFMEAKDYQDLKWFLEMSHMIGSVFDH